MNRFLIVFTALMLSACVKITDTEAGGEGSGADYQVVPLKEPNHYEVRLLVPEGSTHIERVSVKDKSQTALSAKFNDGYLIDSEALSGQEYTYQFGRVDHGQFQVDKEITVQIPRDIVIQNEVRLSQDTVWSDYGRLFLLPSGILTTNGFQLLIQTKSLYALGGTIRTFDAVYSPSNNEKKDGGSIEIQAEEATGIFRIQLLGRKGKQGERSTALLDAADGEKGGSTGHAALKIRKSSDMRFEPVLKPGAGGEPDKPGCVDHICGKPGQVGNEGDKGYFCVENAGARFCY